MELFDIVCGKCGSHDFKGIDGKSTCQGCGYILTDNDIESLLEQTWQAAAKQRSEDDEQK